MNKTNVILVSLICLSILLQISFVSAIMSGNDSRWYLNVSVTDGSNPLQNANVTGYDKNSNFVFSELTDVNGNIPSQFLLEYTNVTLNKSILSGLGDIGSRSYPTVFQKDGNWYLISGAYDGTFFGFNWNGTGWQINSTIISGLNDLGTDTHPTVFQKDGNWYLISSSNEGVIGGGKYFSGYNWNGTQWISNSTIISGLTAEIESNPTVFQKDGVWYLIDGYSTDWVTGSDIFSGYNWDGTQWISNSTIISGLGEFPFTMATLTAFQKDGNWYLISDSYGKIWNGTGWEDNALIYLGLGHCSYPLMFTVFQKDEVWYIIGGQGAGAFCGYNWNETQWDYSYDKNKVINYYSNYTIHTNLEGYFEDITSVNMSMNQDLNVILISSVNATPPLMSWEEVDLDENIVNPDNTEQGLLPSVYYGLATFLSNVMTPAIIIIFVIFFVMIIGVIGVIIKKIAQKI